MQTKITVFHAPAQGLQALPDRSVDLVVTSPPYPMVGMWDECFAGQDPMIGKALSSGDAAEAFSRMHAILDQVWAACTRVLVEGGFACINMDLIAGLPDDTAESFAATLDRILELDPEKRWQTMNPLKEPARDSGRADLLPGVKTALVLFHPEGVAQNPLVRGFPAQSFDLLRVFLPQIFLIFLIVGDGFACTLVVHRPGKLHVDFRLRINFPRPAQMVHQVPDLVQRAVDHRIVDHAQIHLRKNAGSCIVRII